MNLNNKVVLNIKGKNIERFIKRLNTNNIDILKITYVSFKEIIIEIYEKDLNVLKEIKTIYDIIILEEKGVSLIKKNLIKNKYLIFFGVISLIILNILSNIIFEIEVITNNSSLNNYILEQLNKYGIEQYGFSKSYSEIQIIKENILSENKDTIEWLEITKEGIKYIVRLEPRIKNEEDLIFENRHVIASKDGIIKSIVATSGQIVKNINDYVKKGDVIISGDIYLNEEIKNTISANGSVFAETWYTVDVEYPYVYYEELKTGNTKNVFNISFLNYNLSLFDFNKYEYSDIEEKKIFNNELIPFKLTYQTQEEIKIIDQVLTEEEAIEQALLKAKSTIEKSLDEDEYIITSKCLKTDIQEELVKVEVFVAVYENITDYELIVGEIND